MIQQFSRSINGLLIAAGLASLLACSASSSSKESTSSADLSIQSLSNPNKNKNLPSANSASASNLSTTVLTPDWGVAATLTAMGYPPVATGDIRVYSQWVDDPKLPDRVVDLGIRYQPNAELIAQMDVDLVIDNFFYEHIRPMYGDTPAVSVTFMSDGDAQWEDFAKPTRQLGELIGQPQAAEQYLLHVQSQLKAAGETMATRHPYLSKVAVVQFADVNNLRMYSHNSLFEVALNNMGLQLVALEDGNTWGFTPIHLGDLAKLDADTCLIVIEPVSPMLQAELNDNLVWQRLGFGTSRCMAVVAPTWIYGGSSSLVTFANRLQTAKFVGINNPNAELTSKALNSSNTSHGDNKKIKANVNKATLSAGQRHNWTYASEQDNQEGQL
ncbi:ABC transporter substrate-binding protein [Psychrobacter pygoscelis]|uniref:ABC transporter substrate-binding protein n=1 Tax=Psychrobacter pygoscelis TaxID=2488563 RepID=UPI00103F8DDC|nr:ABC transporter substrate-binding protein [Psychrobacter pygoscelis]